MSHIQNQGQCPRCGDANPYTNLVCSGCGSRLPWADALDASRQQASKAIAPAPSPRLPIPAQPAPTQPIAAAPTPPRPPVLSQSALPMANAAVPPQPVHVAQPIPPVASVTPVTVVVADVPQVLGLIGSICLMIGVFMPVVEAPILGGMNYFQISRTDSQIAGSALLLVGVLSLVLTVTRSYRRLWLTGSAALAILAFTFISFKVWYRSKPTVGAANDFSKLLDAAFTEAVKQSVHLSWGLPVLGVGAMLVIAAAAVGYPLQAATVYDQTRKFITGSSRNRR